VAASGDRAGARPAGTTVPLRDSRFPRSRAVPVHSRVACSWPCWRAMARWASDLAHPV